MSSFSVFPLGLQKISSLNKIIIVFFETGVQFVEIKILWNKGKGTKSSLKICSAILLTINIKHQVNDQVHNYMNISYRDIAVTK